MNRKGSFNKFSRSLAVAVIVAVVAMSGCARPPVYEEEERGGGVGSRSRSPWAIPLGLGAVAVGAGALLGGGSKDQEPTQQQGSEQGKEAEERQRKEAEQAKEQKQY